MTYIHPSNPILPTEQALKPFDGTRAWFPAEGRFGVFIHFGLYTYKGGNENDYADFTPETYAQTFLPRCNPHDFDPGQWVADIQDAGASHLVLTTRHGEGFCLWDTATTEFKITRTPFGRDLLAELADACHKGGLRLGLYMATDNWHYSKSGLYEQTEAAYGDFFERQVRELITGYGQVDLFWFDGFAELLSVERVKALKAMIRQMQPSAVVNDRGLNAINSTYEPTGDYITPERFFPTTIGEAPRFIEVCDAMGQKSWGYNSDQNFMSAGECIHRLSRAASIGGNYLLNVEPAPDGTIRPECVDRLKAIGSWMHRHRQSIVGARGCPVKPVIKVEQEPFTVGVTTLGDKALYVHFDGLPKVSHCLLEGVSGTVLDAAFLHNAQSVSWEQTDAGILLKELPDSVSVENPVLRIAFEAMPSIDAEGLYSKQGRTTAVQPCVPTELRPQDACLPPGPEGISTNQLERYANGAISIGRWTTTQCAAIWQLEVAQTGTYRLYARLGAGDDQSEADLEFSTDSATLLFTSRKTGWYGDFQTFAIGDLSLVAGITSLRISARRMKRFAPNVHGLSLVPTV